MNQTMRKASRQMGEEATQRVLLQGEYGVLCTYGEGGYPYGVPMSYAVVENRIYLHGALEGHKMKNLQFTEKVSFTVVGGTKVVPEDFTTYYESVIVFGRVSLVSGEEKHRGLMALIQKYAPDHLESGERYVERATDKTAVLCLTMEQYTGKARWEDV